MQRAQIEELLRESVPFAEKTAGIRRELRRWPFWTIEAAFVKEADLLVSLLPTAEEEEERAILKVARSLDYQPTLVNVADRGIPELDGFVKVAYSPAGRNLLVHWGLLPGKLFGAIPSTPSPIKSMLMGGLIGAGIGYGGGWLGERAIEAISGVPQNKLRRKLGFIGAMAGMAPGTVLGLANLSNNRSWNDNTALNFGTQRPLTKEGAELLVLDRLINGATRMEEPPGYVLTFIKCAVSESSPTGLHNVPPVLTTAFGETVWGDPRVSNRLSESQKGALGTIVYGAANLPYLTRGLVPPSQKTPWLPSIASPTNMAKILTGYGAGRLSASVGSSILGGLFNLPPAVQDHLKTVGGFAGALGQVANIALQP